MVGYSDDRDFPTPLGWIHCAWKLIKEYLPVKSKLCDVHPEINWPGLSSYLYLYLPLDVERSAPYSTSVAT
jgi:hypothetical protein